MVELVYGVRLQPRLFRRLLARRHLERAPDPSPLFSDEVSPSESVNVPVVFQSRRFAEPSGVVVTHGAFPDCLIVDADQGVLLPRTLLCGQGARRPAAE